MTDAAPTGWHPEDIKAAVRKTGITLNALSVRAGLGVSTVRTAILFGCPAGEAAVAEHLDVDPAELWPRRYLVDPTPARLAILESYRTRAGSAVTDKRERPRRRCRLCYGYEYHQ